jgi:Glycosyl transferase family 11
MYQTLTVVALRGNLGNQLFQIAAARAKQRDPRAPVVVDDRVSRTYQGYLDEVLVPGSYRPATGAELAFLRGNMVRIRPWLSRYVRAARTREFVEGSLIRYDERFQEVTPPVLLYGVFQEEEYFKNIVADVAGMFRPARSDELSIIQQMTGERSMGESVAVTVRRGRDYVNLGWSLPIEYYLDACHLIAEKRHRLRFTVFGDDPEACSLVAEQLTEMGPATVASHFDPPTQLQLIAHHDHIVLANSTFSWWAAWLSECRMGRDGSRFLVAPSPWINVTDEIIPPRWHTIQNAAASSPEV